jgi:pyruvate dehydrogenase E2 component (dihydrolipoamide acetyltransferase)/2-oxoisovalerate dehydrogenase E2 component (dihydrolipoyl transacylase)
MDFKLPELGEGVYEAEFVAWQVKVGDTVRSGQNLFEVMTDKATMEVPSPFAGTITALNAKPGQSIKIGDVMLSYTPTGVPEPVKATATRTETAPAPRDESTKATSNGLATPAQRLAVRAAPSVRLMARKLGIDLNRIHGSGPEGRILVEDLSVPVTTVTAAPEKKPAKSPTQDHGKPGTRIKMQGLRRLIAEHMVKAKSTIPHYAYVDECDVTSLVRLRDELKDHFAGQGVKLTYLAFFVKAVVAALKEVPLVNASLDEEGAEIVLHDRYHIGLAVATSGGLIVPVIRDADRKDVPQIAREIERLSEAARTGKAKREELKGGTFTVTSVGNIGGLFSTPVINHPEVGILGVGKIVKRPVFDEQGQIKAADMLYLSLSFDHRVVDGAVGAAFANAVIRRLQQPALLLLSDERAATGNTQSDAGRGDSSS